MCTTVLQHGALLQQFYNVMGFMPWYVRWELRIFCTFSCNGQNWQYNISSLHTLKIMWGSSLPQRQNELMRKPLRLAQVKLYVVKF